MCHLEKSISNVSQQQQQQQQQQGEEEEQQPFKLIERDTRVEKHQLKSCKESTGATKQILHNMSTYSNALKTTSTKSMQCILNRSLKFCINPLKD